MVITMHACIYNPHNPGKTCPTNSNDTEGFRDGSEGLYDDIQGCRNDIEEFQMQENDVYASIHTIRRPNVINFPWGGLKQSSN